MTISEINIKIKEGQDASIDFESYLKTLLEQDCEYKGATWDRAWTNDVYTFGSLFKEHDAGAYLIILKKIFNEENPENEKIAFIYSEIAWNYIGDNNEYIRAILREFTKKYPYNPEFHHTYGHYLMNNKTYDRALDEIGRAHV